MRTLLLSLVLLLGLVCVASAAPNAGPERPAEKSDVPPDTTGSGVTTLKQMTEDLQFLRAEKNGIVVHYIIPKGWEIVEQTKDAKGKPTPGVYVLLSRRPMPDPNEPTDFIFELDIYDQNVYSGIAANLDAKKAQEERGKRLWDFLNAQISFNAKGGLKSTTKKNEIAPKEYGPTTRPKTVFVPIYYDVPPKAGDKKSKGAKLYTFTSVTDGKVWVLKFLVASDQIENYGALIALILDNSFGLTDAEYKKLLETTSKAQQQSKQKSQTKGGK